MDPGSLLMLVVVMGIFYFMLVRPQKKRLAEHKRLVSSLVPGDEVVTIGGIYGFVNRIDDDMVWLEVSEGVEVRCTKQAVSRRVEPDSSEEPEEAAEAELVEPSEADPTP
jgi:preprotein translocase subunit YajC